MRRTPLESRLQSYRDEEIASRRDHAADGGRPGAASGRIAVPVEIEYLPYGIGEQPEESAVQVVATLGPVEAEYAALRRGAGVLDCPDRGTLLVRGAERLTFLDRMLTAALKDLRPRTARPAFWLNRQGRIEADLLLIERGDDLLVDVDIHQAPATASSLGGFLFSEDVRIEDVSEAWHRLAVHGPLAAAVVAAAAGRESLALQPLAAELLSIASAPVTVVRRDLVGDVGLHLTVPRDGVAAVWRALIETDATVGAGRRRVRPAGWYAFNTARIEAGTPLFNVDFGPSSLPHETGVLHERVSFKKGCYLGQEIVARMEHLGRPRQTLKGLRLAGERLPVAGAQILEPAEGPMSTPIGVVTSSTLSPMLGAAPIALGMLRTSHADDGTAVLVNAEGEQVEAIVGPLRLWPPPRAADPAGDHG